MGHYRIVPPHTFGSGDVARPEIDITVDNADYRRKAAALLRLIADRGRYLPDYRRASTGGRVPRSNSAKAAEHPMAGLPAPTRSSDAGRRREHKKALAWLARTGGAARP